MYQDRTEKLAEGRRRRLERTNNRKLFRRRRIRDEVSKLSVAVANMCRECVGFEGDKCTLTEEVRQCTAVRCHLWPWRMGKLNTVGEEELW